MISITFYRFAEKDVHDKILGKLRPGDVFIDGGANIGYYTVLGARAVGPKRDSCCHRGGAINSKPIST